MVADQQAIKPLPGLRQCLCPVRRIWQVGLNRLRNRRVIEEVRDSNVIADLVLQSLDNDKRVCGKARCRIFNRTEHTGLLVSKEATCRFPESEIGYFDFVLAEHEEVELGKLPIIVDERALLGRPSKEQLPLISWQPLPKVA